MSKKEINKNKILWIDLEMTGLEADKNVILELGAIVTDWELNKIDHIELVLKTEPSILEEKFKMNKFWEEFPETKQALADQNESGLSKKEFIQKLTDFIHKNWQIEKPNQDIILAGNTIRVDRAFIDYHLPEISSYLHYRTLDVSSLKIYFEARYGKVYPKPENHRALEDIEGSIAELKFLSKYIKVKK